LGTHRGHQRKTSESITFRLETGILAKLRQEAAYKDISINTLVSQSLRQHIDWHSNAPRAGFVLTRRSFLKAIMDLISEKEISFLSKELAEKETKDFVLLLRHGFDINNSLSVLESWFRASGYSFRHEISDKVHYYVIQHDMGKKMSLVFAEIYRNLFEEFRLRPVEFGMTDNTLSFIVDTSDSTREGR
jgi:hypothetical protein